MILKPKPRAVIFDFDGTLIDSRLPHNEARRLLAKFYSVFGFNLDDGHIPFSRDFLTWLQHAGLNRFQINLYFRFWNMIEWWQRPRIFQGANELILSLKNQGIIVGLLTNRSAYSANNAILRSGLDWQGLDFIAVNKSPHFHMKNPTCGNSFITYAYLRNKLRNILGRCGDKYEKGSDAVNEDKKFVNQYFCDFAKPDPRAADAIRHLLQDLSGYPQSVMYIGDNLLDYYFARDNNFSFAGVLSGDIADIEIWEKAGVKNVIDNIVGSDGQNFNPYLY